MTERDCRIHALVLDAWALSQDMGQAELLAKALRLIEHQPRMCPCYAPTVPNVALDRLRALTGCPAGYGVVQALEHAGDWVAARSQVPLTVALTTQTPLTAAQERDLLAMAALRRHRLSVGGSYDGAHWTATDWNANDTPAGDPAEAILAAAAKLEEDPT